MPLKIFILVCVGGYQLKEVDLVSVCFGLVGFSLNKVKEYLIQ